MVDRVRVLQLEFRSIAQASVIHSAFGAIKGHPMVTFIEGALALVRGRDIADSEFQSAVSAEWRDAVEAGNNYVVGFRNAIRETWREGGDEAQVVAAAIAHDRGAGRKILEHLVVSEARKMWRCRPAAYR
jgi:hypothetical protein